MSNELKKGVSILFETPDGDADARHQRTLWNVPKAVADAMKMNFTQYKDPEFDPSPHQVYRYMDGGEQQIIPLDFSEVVCLRLLSYGPAPPLA